MAMRQRWLIFGVHSMYYFTWVHEIIEPVCYMDNKCRVCTDATKGAGLLATQGLTDGVSLGWKLRSKMWSNSPFWNPGNSEFSRGWELARRTGYNNKVQKGKLPFLRPKLTFGNLGASYELGVAARVDNHLASFTKWARQLSWMRLLKNMFSRWSEVEQKCCLSDFVRQTAPKTVSCVRFFFHFRLPMVRPY
jgi:hypothetical protein